MKHHSDMTESAAERRRRLDRERYLRNREERMARQREYYREHREDILAKKQREGMERRAACAPCRSRAEIYHDWYVRHREQHISGVLARREFRMGSAVK